MEPTTYDLWVAVSAILVILITWAINQLPPRFTDLHKRIVAAVSSAVLATAGVFYQGMLDTADWGRTWLVIFMAATAIYVVIVKPVASLPQIRAMRNKV